MVNVREKKKKKQTEKEKKGKISIQSYLQKKYLAVLLKIYTNKDIKVSRSSVNLLNFLILLKVFCTGL